MTRISSAFILTLLVALVRADTSVYILSENLEQVVTSSTLQWVSSSGFNESMLNNAVVAAYQVIDGESIVVSLKLRLNSTVSRPG
jgi:hypothetical protein